MAGRIRAATPIGSCPDCLSWGASYGSQSYCRACYDFTRRYGRGECAGCRRNIAVKLRVTLEPKMTSTCMDDREAPAGQSPRPG